MAEGMWTWPPLERLKTPHMQLEGLNEGELINESEESNCVKRVTMPQRKRCLQKLQMSSWSYLMGLKG